MWWQPWKKEAKSEKRRPSTPEPRPMNARDKNRGRARKYDLDDGRAPRSKSVHTKEVDFLGRSFDNESSATECSFQDRDGDKVTLKKAMIDSQGSDGGYLLLLENGKFSRYVDRVEVKGQDGRKVLWLREKDKIYAKKTSPVGSSDATIAQLKILCRKTNVPFVDRTATWQPSLSSSSNSPVWSPELDMAPDWSPEPAHRYGEKAGFRKYKAPGRKQTWPPDVASSDTTLLTSVAPDCPLHGSKLHDHLTGLSKFQRAAAANSKCPQPAASRVAGSVTWALDSQFHAIDLKFPFIPFGAGPHCGVSEFMTKFNEAMHTQNHRDLGCCDVRRGATDVERAAENVRRGKCDPMKSKQTGTQVTVFIKYSKDSRCKLEKFYKAVKAGSWKFSIGGKRMNTTNVEKVTDVYRHPNPRKQVTPSPKCGYLSDRYKRTDLCAWVAGWQSNFQQTQIEMNDVQQWISTVDNVVEVSQDAVMMLYIWEQGLHAQKNTYVSVKEKLESKLERIKTVLVEFERQVSIYTEQLRKVEAYIEVQQCMMEQFASGALIEIHESYLHQRIEEYKKSITQCRKQIKYWQKHIQEYECLIEATKVEISQKIRDTTSHKREEIEKLIASLQIKVKHISSFLGTVKIKQTEMIRYERWLRGLYMKGLQMFDNCCYGESVLPDLKPFIHTVDKQDRSSPKMGLKYSLRKEQMKLEEELSRLAEKQKKKYVHFKSCIKPPLGSIGDDADPLRETKEYGAATWRPPVDDSELGTAFNADYKRRSWSR